MASMDIRAMVSAVEDVAGTYEIGKLQSLRAGLRRLNPPGNLQNLRARDLRRGLRLPQWRAQRASVQSWA